MYGPRQYHEKVYKTSHFINSSFFESSNIKVYNVNLFPTCFTPGYSKIFIAPTTRPKMVSLFYFDYKLKVVLLEQIQLSSVLSLTALFREQASSLVTFFILKMLRRPF